MPTEQEYQDIIAYLILGSEALIESEEDNHTFVFSSDGDGWNEPFSESGDCHCGWQGLSWVQTDPRCSGRPSLWEYALEWANHIKKDIWRDDDEGISQDTDPLQEGLDSAEEANDRGRLDDGRP